MNNFECPAIGDKCGYCVSLAQVAFINTYRLAHPGMPTNEVVMAAENSKVEAIVEEEEPLAGQPCNVRQVRAKNIGSRLGATVR